MYIVPRNLRIHERIRLRNTHYSISKWIAGNRIQYRNKAYNDGWKLLTKKDETQSLFGTSFAAPFPIFP